jgi:molecular chaperone HtpG
MVADMVRQFADPYAFLRELVQNAVDAGASAIEVRLELTAEGASYTSVTDDGSGMTREIIEGPLLTLFSSSKEGDESKIGKYGVGFVSIFAVEPDEVEVLTWREAPGDAWRLRLFPDHSYELAHAEPRAGSGTTVTLLQRMDAAQFAQHVDRSRASLYRWCRHVRCPTELVVQGLAGDEAARRERIDRPLAVRSAVQVRCVDTDLDAELVVGCAVDPAGTDPLPPDGERSNRFAGFYSRGLTLFETSSERFRELEHIRFKVDSARLSHTLSRDDVRRDEAFERLVDRVRRVATDELRAAMVRRLDELASDMARGGAANTTYLEVSSAARRAPFALRHDEISVPLANPVDGKSTMILADVGRRSRGAPVCAGGSDALTAELTKAGAVVVLLPEVVLAQRFRDAAPAHATWTLIDELPAPAVDSPELTLLQALVRALGAADAPVARAGLARFLGARVQPGAVMAPPPRSRRRIVGWAATERAADRRTVVRAAELAERWRAWPADSALLLDVDGAPWQRALSSRATASARGQLLARLLLVAALGPLSARDNDSLLAAMPGVSR